MVTVCCIHESKITMLPAPDEEDEIRDSSMEPISIISRMLFWFSCDVQESELWSNKVVSLVPV